MTKDPTSNSPLNRRPTPDESADYYHRYIDRVPDGDFLTLARQQQDDTAALLGKLSPEQQTYRYAPGKWTVNQVLGHLIDTEWVFVYRALRMARGDQTPLPGMEQDDFVAGANFNERTMAGLLSEFRNLRAAGLTMFESFDESILDRVGNASGFSFSVRSLIYIIAGHERHHVGVLKQKYLS